ncbi:hypothetical protein HPP92_008285 [Vanilla planifolia]|uniref:Uncharacterized protein n=1 Tax=Vanilla planifolia TaxID=51239 RepID=A0A835V734_VANPL|nr:hypothetical protein HPP92_008285 [Vanilla planifolia]
MALPLQFSTLSFSCRRPLLPCHRFKPLHVSAIGPDGKFRPRPSDEEPPEASDDSSHGVSPFERFQLQVAAARRRQEEQFKKDQPLFLSAFALEEDPASPADVTADLPSDDPFNDIDRAISLKRQELVKQGLLPPTPPQKENIDIPVDSIDELTPEEILDIEEIDELHGLTVISSDKILEENPIKMPAKELNAAVDSLNSTSFELDIDRLGKSKGQILEPKFRMTLAELLDESQVVPIAVYGDLEVHVTGIQNDPKEVSSGDLFICCAAAGNDGICYITEAVKRGAVAVVSDKEIDLDETLECKALVIVEDTDLVVPVIATSFLS